MSYWAGLVRLPAGACGTHIRGTKWLLDCVVGVGIRDLVEARYRTNRVAISMQFGRAVVWKIMFTFYLFGHTNSPIVWFRCRGGIWK